MRAWWFPRCVAASIATFVVGCSAGPAPRELSKWEDYRVLISAGNWEPGSAAAGELLGVDATGDVVRLSQVGIDDGKPTVNGSALLIEGDTTAQWVDGGRVTEIPHPGGNGLHVGSAIDDGRDRAVSVFNMGFSEDGSHYLSPAFWYADGRLTRKAILPWNILGAPVVCGPAAYVPIDDISMADLTVPGGAGVARLGWDGSIEPFWFEGELAGLDSAMSDGPACVGSTLSWIATIPRDTAGDGAFDGPLVVVNFDVDSARVEAMPLILDSVELTFNRARIATSSYAVDDSLVWAAEDGTVYVTQVASGRTTRRGELPTNFTENNVQMYLGEHGLSVLAEDRSTQRLTMYRLSSDGRVTDEVSLDPVLSAIGKKLAWDSFVDLHNRPAPG